MSAKLALILIAMLAAPALAQDDAAGRGALPSQEVQPPSFSGWDAHGREVEQEDEDPLDRWQRDDDADQLEDRQEQRQQRRHDKQLDGQPDEPEHE